MPTRAIVLTFLEQLWATELSWNIPNLAHLMRKEV